MSQTDNLLSRGDEIIGCPLPSNDAPYSRRCLTKAKTVTRDPSHLRHSVSELLLMGTFSTGDQITLIFVALVLLFISENWCLIKGLNISCKSPTILIHRLYLYY